PEVAKAGRRVVCVPGHVLVVAEEDDEPVEPPQPLRPDPVELAVRDEVDALALAVEPAQEPELVRADARRYTAMQVRPGQVDALDGVVCVPGVTDPVAVDVAVVVRLPSVRREDDGDVVASEPGRQEHERREADAAVAGAQPDEVETARAPRRAEPEHGRPVTVCRPVDPDRGADRDAEQLVRAVAAVEARTKLGPGTEELEREAPGVGRDDEVRARSWPVPLAAEAGVDAQ